MEIASLVSCVSCVGPSSVSVSGVICNRRLVICCPSPPSLYAGLVCFVLFGGLLRRLSVQAVVVPYGEAPLLMSSRRTVPSLVAPGLSSPCYVSAPSPWNELEYLRGRVLEDMHFELDEWSLQEIVSELQKLGYKRYAKIWYYTSGCQLSSSLRELMSNGDAMRMGRLLVSQTVKHCSVYVVDGCRKDNGVEICSNDKDYVPTEAEYSGSGFVEVEVEGESEASSEEDRFDDSADDGDHEDHFGFDVEDENDGGFANAFGGFDGPLNEHDNAQAIGVDAAVNDVTVRDDIEVGEIFEDYETEDIDSYEGDSDDMIKKRRYPKYNEAEMSREYEFKVGLEFKSLGQFKDAIREHALLNGKDIRYIKNDKILLSKGFLAGCRPIIGVNGCHLKGDHGQQLLVAVERDPNDNYFPIAVVAVEIETRNSWSWFINLLLDDIRHVNRKKWVFISDQQKDLMQVFQEIIPALKHRLCLRHLILEDKPILNMFEWIRCYWISRFTEKKKKKVEKYKDTIMLKPKRLDVIATRAMEWQARWAGGLTYEVSHKNRMTVERFVVDLLAGTYSCRFWGLCEMPCLHACCATFEKGDNPENYCSNFYSPVAYVAIYGKLVSLINGENMWPKVECDTIIPPIFRVKPERPRMVSVPRVT
ncbi:hypothetical protein Ahy_A02g008555 [Arachis hypogaea]|uniref:Uncharacterized protein n=1 Tax=Arachis hypogaea TaxID=3818 RepID=A0A445EEX3_ARAHY|nr:hypothetical protein Ahy_A02g008555 [Arachis hypogaea]